MPASVNFDEESVAATSQGSPETEHTGVSFASSLEHTGDTRSGGLKKAHSYLSQCTTHLSHEGSSAASVSELNVIKPDVENALGVEPCEEVSIWTWRSIGIVFNGFLLAFLSATCTGVAYGFFLGYMGLDSYVMSSITALMKLPDVFLLPYGVISDCFPIRGQKRKPWLLVSWAISALALLALSLKPQPAPFYCQYETGDYNWDVPPCNPGIHKEKNWYIFPMFILTAGLQMGSVNGQALLLEYSQREPMERRGKIKAEMTMVCTAGALASSVVIGIFMNGRAYLGTFDWGLSFSGLMTVCLVLVLCIIPVTVLCVYEPQKSGQRTSCRSHVKGSWDLVQTKALSSLLFFAFFVQFLVSLTTTAGPMVRSQWAHVKVLQQQMFGMAGMGVMMAATWVYKTSFLQLSWRKAILIAIISVTVLDAVPQFLATFGVVRNQYFYLGEDVVSSIPNAMLQLVSNLMIIELAEPGREGLCYGLIGTFQQSAIPFATVISNQVYGLFNPKLSSLENYILDTPQFRSTVAWSYVLTYSTSFLALALLPMIPWQKAEAQRRKREWSSNSVMAAFVLLIPAMCLIYGIFVLLLTSQPETACLRWVGGQGCEMQG
ncbi:IIV3-029R [Symbiodinium necroappetens]|uniref:IIV3-029R protein n=1 Tax=Symbiodinium necroappetens TaxID=1628268 RepID=A0A813CEX8_9DINO|nr:IIV3-029R [Symbiodinium necroappetens]